MNLKEQFLQWSAKQANDAMLPHSLFIEACLDAAIEQCLSTTINGIQFSQYYPIPEQMWQVLRGWQSIVFSFLEASCSEASISFRGVPVPTGATALEIQSLFREYIGQF